MEIPAFDIRELKVVREISLPFKDIAPLPVYDYPVTPKEAVHLLYSGTAPWQIMPNQGVEFVGFNPSVIPDNKARALVRDGTMDEMTNRSGGYDMFGVEWEYVPIAHGSMVKPGKPFIGEPDELRSKIVWPDVHAWDWDGCQKQNEAYLAEHEGQAVSTLFLNGWFERLISLMDFENAVISLIDEDVQEDIMWFFDKLSDTYIEILDELITRYPQIDVFCIHDDWGSQQQPFFSLDTAMEMIVPYMRRVTDYIHSRGRFADLHSCGHIEDMVPAMIEAGWDSWNPQEMNDMGRVYDLYGDKILVAVMPEWFDCDEISEDEQRAQARAYAERFCNADKPSSLNMYMIVSARLKPFLTQAFCEELYIQSRMAYQ